jgi:hypothetical protein
MKKFSQRKGFKPVSETIQVNGMSEELRNSLWNVLDVFLFKTDEITLGQACYIAI